MERMRSWLRVVVVVALVVACSKARKPMQGIRLVYAIDLDKAIDDRALEIKRDVAAMLADHAIAATIQVSATRPGTVTIEPQDPMRFTTTSELIRSNYHDVATVSDCTSDPGVAVCLQLSPAFIATLRMAAMDQALTAIRLRIDQLHVTDPAVFKRDETIVIEVPGDPASKELVAVRNLIARGGNLEMKVVDDCAAPAAAGCTTAGDHTGSPFMKRLYAHVGSDRDGKPTDPDAQRAGIRGDVDQWLPEDGGSRHADYYLRADDRAVLERYLRELAIRDPSFQPPDDHQLGFELVVPSPDAADHHSYWRTYYLESATRMTGAEIASATAASDPNTNRPLVLLDFGKRGGHMFGDLTSQIVGMKLATILDGTVRSAPIINGAIHGGRASITMGGADPEAQERERDELVATLKSGALPAPLRELSVTEIHAP